MPGSSPPPAVVIALCTLNGARWLPEQLDSIAAQEMTDWVLWASDDGSTDDTPAILDGFAARFPGRVRRLAGPRRGAAAHYLGLICHPDLPLGPATHLALSDQDDIWQPAKLGRALDFLARQPDRGQRPLIYGAQSLHIGEGGRVTGRSRRPHRPVSLRNAVVQNMVSGHSLMLDPLALALARQAGVPPGLGFQDWWLSFLVLACGGRAAIDLEEVLLYRQHGANLMGAPQGLGALRSRLGLLMRSDFARWVAANLAGLEAPGLPLTPEAQRLRGLLAGGGGGPARLARVIRAGLYRQSRPETALIWLAALLGRV